MNKDGVRKKVFLGLFWTFLERSLSQGITLIVSIILARLLLPEEFGLIAIVMAFITIAEVFITSGFGNSLVQKKNADDLDFSSMFFFSVFISWIIYGLLFVLAPLISRYYENQDLTLILRVLSLYIPLLGFNVVPQAIIIKKMIFKKLFFTTLSSTIFSAILGIVIAYLGGGVWALVVQKLSNALVNTVILFIIVRWTPKLTYSRYRMKSLISYGWKLMAASTISSIFENLNSLIIGKRFSPQELAFFTQGQSYPRQIGTNINSTISRVMFPALSGYQSDVKKMKIMVRRSIKTSTFIMSPLLVGLALISEPLIKLLLTEKWMGIVPFIQIFSIYYIFVPVHTVNLQAIKALGRSDLFLKLELIKRFYGVSILLLMLAIFDTVTSIALGMIAQTLISCIVNSFPNKKLISYGYFEQFKDIIPNIGISAMMGIFVFTISYFFDFNNVNSIIFKIGIGFLFFITTSILFKNDSYIYLRTIIFSKKQKNDLSEREV